MSGILHEFLCTPENRGGVEGTAPQAKRSLFRFIGISTLIGIFHLPNSSGRTVALGSTKHRTEKSTMGTAWVKKRSVLSVNNFTNFISRFSNNSGSLKPLEPERL